jgi:hypothetical protein
MSAPEGGRGPHNQLLVTPARSCVCVCACQDYEPKGLLHRLRALPSEVSQMRPLPA